MLVGFSECADHPIFFTKLVTGPDDAADYVTLALAYGVGVALVDLRTKPLRIDEDDSPLDVAHRLLVSSLGAMQDAGVMRGMVLVGGGDDPDVVALPPVMVPTLSVPLAQILRDYKDADWPGSLPFTCREIADALDAYNQTTGMLDPAGDVY